MNTLQPCAQRFIATQIKTFGSRLQTCTREDTDGCKVCLEQLVHIHSQRCHCPKHHALQCFHYISLLQRLPRYRFGRYYRVKMLVPRR